MIDRVSELINGGFKNINIDSLVENYRAIFGKGVRRRCEICLYEAFYELREWLHNEIQLTQIVMAKNNKYKLKDVPAGGRFVVMATGIAYTPETFTDEDAEVLKAAGLGEHVELVEAPEKKKTDDTVKN